MLAQTFLMSVKNFCCKLTTVLLLSRAETFAKVEDAKKSILTDSRKFMHAKFFMFFLSFYPNLLASLDNALILVAWRKTCRGQCNTKTR